MSAPPVAYAAILLIMVCGAMLVSTTELAAQQTCQNEAINVTGPELTPLLDYSQGCSVDGQPADGKIIDGTFVKKGANLKQGAKASLTGQCIVRYLRGSQCLENGIYYRNIDDVFLSFFDPTGDTPGINYPMTFMGNPASQQTIDSTIPGTTNGPIGRMPVEEGTWHFRYWVLSSATQCHLPRTHPESQIEVNVTECKPEWYVNNGINFHAPPAPPVGVTDDIRIVVPASNWQDAVAPLQAAAAEWSQRLGRNIAVDVGGTACDVYDPRCIRLNQTYYGSDCALFEPGSYDPSGAWIMSPLINLRPTWRWSHPDHLKQRFSHELGHYFGLENRLDPSCSCDDTTMGYSLSYCDDPLPPSDSTCTLLATAGDALALKPTYGSGNRKICGW